MVRAIPGPVFSVASFTGGMALQPEGKKMQMIGCIIGSIAIFLPSALLVLFFFPVWQYLQKFVVVYRALEGIHAVVVGLMWAATLYLLHGFPLKGFNQVNIISLAVIIGTFVLLRYTRIPAPVLVLICLFFGWLF